MVTGWNQLYGSAQYSLDAMWPKNTKVDMLGVDIYNKYGVVKDGTMNMKSTDMEGGYFKPVNAWAKNHGVAWGVAETGYTDKASVDDPQWIQRTYNQMKANDGVAFTYFNTTLNSVANWALSTAAKKNAFTATMRTTPTL